MEETVSAVELQDWDLYYRLEPWGAIRDNMHAGIIAARIFNSTRGKDDRAHQMSDYMLIERPSKDQTVTHKFVAALRALAKPRKK